MHIGIDVGGTNTDAVLMDGRRVLAATKTVTTLDVTSGIVRAIRQLRDAHPFDPAAVHAVMIGTTHFINAIVEARGLSPTAAVRLGLPATSALPPFVDWPTELREAIGGHAYLCHGGHLRQPDAGQPDSTDFGQDRFLAGIRLLTRGSVRLVKSTTVFRAAITGERSTHLFTSG